MQAQEKKDVAVITIHGMGKHDPKYNAGLVRKLKRYFDKNAWNRVHVEAVDYQQFLQSRQEEFWDKIDDEYSLRWDFLRKFLLFSFGDAAAIEHSLHSDGNQELYRKVHGEIARAFKACFKAFGEQPQPVVVVAQSLGCEQISNYIWDATKRKRWFEGAGDSDLDRFQRLESCGLLVTTGCNIPIFRASLDSPMLFDRPNDEFIWKNFFDKDDCLGYPIRMMSESYEKDWVEDKVVSVGGLFRGWNPKSHGKYWTDTDVVEPVAEWTKDRLSTITNTAPPPEPKKE